MLINCYQKHNSDFEPKDCAKYFKEQGVEVIISSDYTDDKIVIEVQPKEKNQKPFVFCSYKMDRATKNELLSEYPNYKTALKNCNSIAEITTKTAQDDVLASILLSYLHLRHKAQIIDPTVQKFRGQKALKNLRENSLAAFKEAPQKLSILEIIRKYHLVKVAITIALVVGYLVYNYVVDYNTTLFVFLGIISLAILWTS